mmetsp:Transcript_118271/g.377003  ORF Transcript_118271/g.377003 Transcript_118271/m.377003 type:complete len:469 (+) Transcript_118271:605-2011(+)
MIGGPVLEFCERRPVSFVECLQAALELSREAASQLLCLRVPLLLEAFEEMGLLLLDARQANSEDSALLPQVLHVPTVFLAQALDKLHIRAAPALQLRDVAHDATNRMFRGLLVFRVELRGMLNDQALKSADARAQHLQGLRLALEERLDRGLRRAARRSASDCLLGLLDRTLQDHDLLLQFGLQVREALAQRIQRAALQPHGRLLQSDLQVRQALPQRIQRAALQPHGRLLQSGLQVRQAPPQSIEQATLNAELLLQPRPDCTERDGHLGRLLSKLCAEVPQPLRGDVALPAKRGLRAALGGRTLLLEFPSQHAKLAAQPRLQLCTLPKQDLCGAMDTPADQRLDGFAALYLLVLKFCPQGVHFVLQLGLHLRALVQQGRRGAANLLDQQGLDIGSRLAVLLLQDGSQPGDVRSQRCHSLEALVQERLRGQICLLGRELRKLCPGGGALFLEVGSQPDDVRTQGCHSL